MSEQEEWYEEEKDSSSSDDSDDETKRDLKVLQKRLLKLGFRQGALEVSSTADSEAVDYKAFKEGFEEISTGKEKIVQCEIRVDEDRVWAATVLRMKKSCFVWMGVIKDTPRLSQMNLSVPFADRAVSTPLLGGTDRFRYDRISLQYSLSLAVVIFFVRLFSLSDDV